MILFDLECIRIKGTDNCDYECPGKYYIFKIIMPNRFIMNYHLHPVALAAKELNRAMQIYPLKIINFCKS